MAAYSNLQDGGDESAPQFEPVALRARHDGWTPDRQLAFLRALADCGCVEEACQRVGKSAASAYALRNRPMADSFRFAWDSAVRVGTRCLADAAFSRALHGVETPIFFQGQQVGVRRTYDERLTQLLLRYRDPIGYGRQNDRVDLEQREDAPSVAFNIRLSRVKAELRGRDWRQTEAEIERQAWERHEAEREAALIAEVAPELLEDDDWDDDEDENEGDVASTSSTSAEAAFASGASEGLAERAAGELRSTDEARIHSAPAASASAPPPFVSSPSAGRQGGRSGQASSQRDEVEWRESADCVSTSLDTNGVGVQSAPAQPDELETLESADCVSTSLATSGVGVHGRCSSGPGITAPPSPAPDHPATGPPE